MKSMHVGQEENITNLRRQQGDGWIKEVFHSEEYLQRKLKRNAHAWALALTSGFRGSKIFNCREGRNMQDPANGWDCNFKLVGGTLI